MPLHLIITSLVRLGFCRKQPGQFRSNIRILECSCFQFFSLLATAWSSLALPFRLALGAARPAAARLGSDRIFKEHLQRPLIFTTTASHRTKALGHQDQNDSVLWDDALSSEAWGYQPQASMSSHIPKGTGARPARPQAITTPWSASGPCGSSLLLRKRFTWGVSVSGPKPSQSGHTTSPFSPM